MEFLDPNQCKTTLTNWCLSQKLAKNICFSWSKLDLTSYCIYIAIYVATVFDVSITVLEAFYPPPPFLWATPSPKIDAHVLMYDIYCRKLKWPRLRHKLKQPYNPPVTPKSLEKINLILFALH